MSAVVVSILINSLENYIGHIREHVTQWGEGAIPWFRGEPEVDTPLLPKVFRYTAGGRLHNENQLLQMFRMKSPSFSQGVTPPRGDTDQWLFLAQHVGLPTRLLDWTESALLGLYFALRQTNPVVWMLDPFRLNQLSITPKLEEHDSLARSYPLTWFDPRGPVKNIGVENIKGAWEINYGGLELPVAVHPTYIHPRMSAQRSVFTIHGSSKEPLSNLVPSNIIRKFIIDPGAAPSMIAQLHMLGIHDSTAFPDLDGLASELSDLY